MRVKTLILVFVLCGSTNSLFGQDSRPYRLYLFDDEKFNERLKEYREFQFDTLATIKDSISTNLNDHHSMRIIEVPKDKMALMPMMSFNHDIQYTMPIKKYKNFYIPKSSILQKDSLFNRKDVLPRFIPKEK